MSAQIEVILVDGGGTASETQAANDAGQRTAESGAYRVPDSVNKAPDASRDAAGRLPATSQSQTPETTRQSGTGAGVATDARNVNRSLAPVPGSASDGGTLDRLQKTLDRFGAEGAATLGTRRTDDVIGREAAQREAARGQVGQDAGESITQEDQPKKEDFRDLTTAVGDFAKKWTPQSIVDALQGAMGRDKERIERTESTATDQRRERTDRATSDQRRERSSTASSSQDRSRSSNVTREIRNRLVDRFQQTRVGQTVGRLRDRVQGVTRNVTGRLQRTQAFQRGSQALGRVAGRTGARFLGGTAGRLAGGVARTAATATTAGTASAGAAGAAGASAGAGGAAAGAAGAAAATGPVAIVIAALAVTIGGAILAVKKFSDVFNQQADALEDVSGPIAAVRAAGQARSEIQRIERAERIGPQTAQMEAARQRANEALYELGTQLYELLSTQADKVEVALDVLTAMLRAMAALKEAADVAIVTLGGGGNRQEELAEFREAAAALAKAVGDVFANNEDFEGRIDPALRAILDFDGEPDRPRVPPNEEL